MIVNKSIPGLVVVVDAVGCLLPIHDVVNGALAGGADQVQIREPGKTRDEIALLVQQLLSTGIDPARLTINGQPELAVQFNTNLHLPERMSDVARPAEFTSRLVSRSIHEPIDPSNEPDADYLVAGNALETSSKEGKTGFGVEGARSIVASTLRPIVLIGGITPETVEQFSGIGVAGFAVRSYVIGSRDPELATHQLVEVIRQHGTEFWAD